MMSRAASRNGGGAAFVLKYRIMEKKSEGVPTNVNFDEASKQGIAGGIQELKIVRLHAAEWAVSPAIGGCHSPEFRWAHLWRAQRHHAFDCGRVASYLYGVGARRQPGCSGCKFHDALTAAGAKPETHIYTAAGTASVCNNMGQPAITGSSCFTGGSRPKD